MKKRYDAWFIIIVLIMGGLIIPFDRAEGGETRLQVDTSAFRLVPFGDIITAMEDEKYNSGYYSIMGELTVNSFSTDGDWLTWEYTEALEMNMTDNEGFWTFDLGDGADISGNSNDGTLYGPTSAGGISAAGQALSFDGDDYIEIPHSDSLNITSEITVEAWIFPTFDDSGEHMILSKGYNWDFDQPQDYELTMDKDRPLFQMKLPGSEDWYGAAPSDPITKNTWHHVAGVYDGARFYIYIDGMNQTSIYTGWGGDYRGEVYHGGLPTSEHNISIGRREPASWGSLFWEGSIDEVRVWDRAIPGREIREHASIPGSRCLNLTGTPDNGDVGDCNVVINVTDGENRYDEHRFTLTVENVPPNILTLDVLVGLQDEEYRVEYKSDETEGTITWNVDTDAAWLSMDPATGILSGTPTYADVGTHQVTVTVNDGNGGLDPSTFDLEVLDVNDPPWITTENVLTAVQGEYYHVDYEGEDLDGEALTWSLNTDAEWLSIDPLWGILNGTPTNNDVGVWYVNITAMDPRGLFDRTNFSIEVLNRNDIPFWVDVPENTSIEEGSVYSFDVNAADIDAEDELSYSISSYPESNITIDGTSGLIEWTATRSIFNEPDLTLSIMIEVTDGEEVITYHFRIDLLLNPSPTTDLLSPTNRTTVSNNTVLVWSGEDDEDEPICYDVYLGQVKSDILSLSTSSMIASGCNDTQWPVLDLEEGKTYYWTVIPQDRFSSGTCRDEMFSFYVNVPPTTDLTYPKDGDIVPYNDPVLECSGYDHELDPIEYHYYISLNRDDVERRSNSSHHTGGPTYQMLDAEAGAVYYWTVIAEDSLSSGTCTDGIYMFTVNVPPTINAVEDLQAHAGSEVRIDVNGSDEDTEMADLEFSLIDGPEGMLIAPTTGIISWTPKAVDIGQHTVTVQLTDGYDPVEMSFQIEVLEAPKEGGEEDEKSDPLLFIIAIAVLIVLIIIGVVIFLFMKKKKIQDNEPPEEEQDPGPIPDFTSDPGKVGDIDPDIPPDPLVSGMGTAQPMEAVPPAGGDTELNGQTAEIPMPDQQAGAPPPPDGAGPPSTAEPEVTPPPPPEQQAMEAGTQPPEPLEPVRSAELPSGPEGAAPAETVDDAGVPNGPDNGS